MHNDKIDGDEICSWNNTSTTTRYLLAHHKYTLGLVSFSFK